MNDCLRFVSRVKDLKQWVSVFSVWLQKSPYKEWLREVKGDKHKARCIVCMKDFGISSMGKPALTSHLKGKKHQTLTSQKRSSASAPDFFGVLLNDQQLRVMMPKKFQNPLHLKAANTVSSTPQSLLRVHLVHR